MVIDVIIDRNVFVLCFRISVTVRNFRKTFCIASRKISRVFYNRISTEDTIK